MTNVYFSPLKCKSYISPLNKIKKLLNRCDVKDIYNKNDLVALKLHFGELGNTAFLRPIYLRPIIELLKSFDVKPFLTDTNTLYVGMRTNSVDHIHNANFNGFGYSTLQTPIIIADGLRGENYTEVSIPNGKILKTAKIATGILNADAIIIISHFKGHEMTGFGGAIKNLSMGCAARAGKLEMHSVSKPLVVEDKCTACGRCKQVCQVNAIEISKTAKITEKCTGCALCVGICPQKAIKTKFDNSNEMLQQRMAEYAGAVVNSFKKQIVYLNILTSISPACDCLQGNDEPVTRDLGFLSGTDPVAVDTASYDLVKDSCGGVSPFSVNGEMQLDCADRMGYGSKDYTLKVID